MNASPKLVRAEASRGSATAAADTFEVEWLGRVDYAKGLEIQAETVEAVRHGLSGDRLLLMEHPAVITLGRSSDPAHILESRPRLAARGVEVFSVARGGDVTYHAPGQLVGYLIRDLRAGGEPDLHRFLRDIEGALIEAVRALGVQAYSVLGKTGVYVPGSAHAPERFRAAEPLHKIASIGVGVRHWISHQGFALNVDLDLRGFDAIVPCGLEGVVMTSLAEASGESDPELAPRVRRSVTRAFRRRFGGRARAPGA